MADMRAPPKESHNISINTWWVAVVVITPILVQIQFSDQFGFNSSLDYFFLNLRSTYEMVNAKHKTNDGKHVKTLIHLKQSLMANKIRSPLKPEETTRAKHSYTGIWVRLVNRLVF